MKKRVRNLIIIILALLMILPTVISCANNNLNEQDTTNPSGTTADASDNTTAATPSNVDENGYLLDDLPSSFDFAKSEIGILYWEDVELQEFFAEKIKAEPVNDAIYRRNLKVSDRLGVKLNYIPQPGRNSALKEYTTRVTTSISSNDHEFDIMAAYSQTMANVTYNGGCADISKLENLDLEKPWWPKTLTDEAMMNGKLYFVSGDISTNLLYFMYCTFFNKDLIKEYSREDPYELVNNNQWTLDKYMEMCKTLYKDNDNSGTKNYGDQIGTIVPWLSLDAFFYGSELRTTDKDETGKLIISPSYSGERSIALAEKLNSLLFVGDEGYWMKEDKGNINTQFSSGLVMLYTQRTKDAILEFSDSSLKYGVVPVPKYDAEQEDYITCMGNPFTLYGMIFNCDEKDEKLVGAVLECLASESYRQTTPAVFEVTLKVKYANDETTAHMYDIIKENVVFDIGRIFGMTMEDYTQTKYRNMIGGGEYNWATKFSEFEKPLERYLDTLNRNLAKITG